MTNASVTVRLFAVLRERAGASEITIPVDQGSSVGDVLAQVYARFPQIRAFDGYLRTAVNTKYASREDRVTAGDEVALISPVSGG